MAELPPGSDSEGFERSLQQMREMQGVKQELDVKDQQLRGAEEAVTGALIDNTVAVERAITENRGLGGALAGVSQALAAETELLALNTSAWVANVEARARAARTGRVGAEAGTVVGGGAITPHEGVTAATQRLWLPASAAPPAAAAAPAASAAAAAETEEARAAREAAAAERQRAEAVALATQREAQQVEVTQALAAAQVRQNLAVNESVAAYAESSTALSRHGALTTEFIQAFARGDVTLKEFGSQVTSTIGKFGGWAVAGAMVYGVYDAVKKLGQGAAETQEGIQNLSRFIPSVTSGPDRMHAEQTFRDISQEMNLPISEVTSAMSIMARVFHGVSDAGDATRATLLAMRLDQIPQGQAEQYFTGITQSLGFTSGRQLIGVVDSLNALQNLFGARVSQTLPALARAAPAAQAGGLDTFQLEAMVGTMVRSGLTGPQAGTAILRSIGTMAFRPQSETVFRRYGINAERGQYGELIDQLYQRVVHPAAGHGLTGGDISALATALGGTMLGPRAFVPFLEHIGYYKSMEHQAAAPPSAGEELQKVLGGVGEEFRRLGVTLENIGSELESAGLLQPISVLLQALGLLGTVVEHAITPIEGIVNVFTQLPGPVKDAMGVFAALAAMRAIGQTGVGMTARDFIGRLPGLGELQDRSGQVIRDTTARYRTFVAPRTEGQVEQARARAMDAQYAYGDALAVQRQRAAVPGALEEGTGANEAYQAAVQDAVQAERRVATTAADLASLESRLVDQKQVISTLTSDQLSSEEKLAYIIASQLEVGERTTVSMRQLQTAANEAGIAMARQAGAIMSSGLAEGADVRRLLLGSGLGPGTAAEGAVKSAAMEGQAAAGAGASVVDVLLAGSMASGGFAAAFRGATPGVQLAAAGALAEAEAPGIVTGSLTSSLGSAALLRGMGAPTAAPAASEAAVAALTGPGMMARAGGAAMGMAGSPWGWLIGTQLAGMVLPGAAGNFTSQVGGTAAMGAILATMGGRAAGGLLSRLPFVGGALESAPEVMSNPLFGAGLALGLSSMSTGGAAGALEGTASGAMMGFAVGGPLGALAGGAIGLGANLLLGGDQQQQGPSASLLARNKALGVLQEQISGARPSPGAYNQWSDQFAGLLGVAYGGNETTQDAQAASQQVQRSVMQAAKLLGATGVTTPIGSGQMRLMEQAISSAVISPEMRIDPYNVGQVIDQAWSGLTTSIGNQFKYATTVASGPRAQAQALQVDISRINSAYGASAGDAVRIAQTNLTDLHNVAALPAKQATPQLTAHVREAQANLAAVPQAVARYKDSWMGTLDPASVGHFQEQLTKEYTDQLKAWQTLAKGTTAAHPNIQGAINEAWAEMQQASSAAKQLGQQKTESIAQDAQAVYGNILSWAQGTAQMAEAAAGGDQLAIAKAQLTQANTALQAARTTPGMDPSQRHAAIGAAQLQRSQSLIAVANAGLAQAILPQQQAQAEVPSWLPLAQAKAQLATDTATWDYMKQHAHEFGIAVAQAANKVAADALIIAQDAYQTQASLIQAREQLAQAQAPANAAAQGAIQAASGAQMLGIARTPGEQLAARAMIASGNVAAAEGARQATQLQYQTQQAQESGDAVAQAYTGIAAGQAALASALGPDEVRAAQLQIAQADAQLHQALLGRIVAVGDLQASETVNPVQQDYAKYQAQLRALAAAVKGGYGQDVIRQYQSQANQAAIAYYQESINQNESLIMFQGGMMQISVQTMMGRLQSLLKARDISIAQRQQIEQQIRLLQFGQFTPFGMSQTQFDIAPGNIRMPTPYDVVHALQGARPNLPRNTHAVHAEVATEINVYVRNEHDVPAVADAIDRSTGSALRARLRAAGLRGA